MHSLTLCASKLQKTLAFHLHAPRPNGFDSRVAATAVHFPYIPGVLEIVSRLMGYGRAWLTVCLFPPAFYIVRPNPLDHIVL